MELHLPNLTDGYVQVVHGIVATGRSVTCRELETRELINVTLVFDDPLAPLLPLGVGRGVNLRFAAVEALSLVGGVSRPDLLERAAPGYDRVLVDARDRDYGAYGPRVINQVSDALALLRADPSTRQAVVTIWNERDLTHEGDKPCTLTLQFLVRDDALELHATMRSQDAWLGLAYDAFMFSQLQHTVARELRVPCGRYVHHVNSLHLYESHLASTVNLHPRYAAKDDAAQRHVDELPLGVVKIDEFNSGFSVARYLLENARSQRVDAPTIERDANPWYVAQLDRVFTVEDNR